MPENYGLLGAPQPSMGLLDDPRMQALMAFGGQALAGSGWSTTPQSFGQAIGPAIMQGMNAYNSGRRNAVQNALLKRTLMRQDKKDARQEAEFARQEQLREMFPSAFNEDGTVNPAAIPDIARVSPGVATQLAGMLPATSREPKYQIVTVTMEDGRKIQGRIDVNAANPESTFQPIGSPETKPIPAESSAKKAAIDQGIALIPGIRDLLFDGGDFKESVVIDSPFVSINPAKRELTPKILSAVEAVLRAESGAAVPEEEVRRAAQRYMPSALDPDEVAKQKIDLLEDRLRRAQEAFEVGRPGSRTSDTMDAAGGWSIQAVE